MLQLKDGDGTGSPPVAFKVDMLTVALWMLSILYAFCLTLAHRKLRSLNRQHPEMGTKKLLILSLGLVCLVRIMTILGVAAMNIANVRAHYSLQPTDAEQKQNQDVDNEDKNLQEFYDTAMTVLFDLPNCIVVSTYVLLTLVWAECFLESRFHTESSVSWRKQWLVGYMVFNTVLYATQLALYTCILFTHTDKFVRTILYAAITGTNFTAVSIVIALYVYVSLHFSGFPFRSERSRRSFSKLSSLMMLWSMTRVMWGIATLLVYLCHVELLQDSESPVWSFLVLLILFFVCEIVPILSLLDNMDVIGVEQRQLGNGSASQLDGVISPMDLLTPQQLDPLLVDHRPDDSEGTQRVRWTDQEHQDDQIAYN